MTDILLFAFLALSACTDIRYRKVFNLAALPAVILGLGLNWMTQGPAGLLDSFLGLAAGFLFLFLFYLLGAMGAGDVKFMAAVGSIKGLHFVLAGGLYGALLGGLAAVAVMAARKRLAKTLKELAVSVFVFASAGSAESLRPPKDEKKTCLPYTVFLSLGMLLQYLFPHWLRF
ncbi:MAG: prepilin peptidase [Endomicrobiales bacterium]